MIFKSYYIGIHGYSTLELQLKIGHFSVSVKQSLLPYALKEPIYALKVSG